MCFHWEGWGSSDSLDDPYGEISRPKSPSELKAWRERFYRAMYRILLAGAVFFKPYSEPFSPDAKGVPPNFLEDYLKNYFVARDDPLDESGVADWPYTLPQLDVDYLTRSPVFDLNASEDRENSVFGQFAEWLIEDSKGRAEENLCQQAWTFDIPQVSAIWETMMMVAAYEHLVSQFINGDGKIGFGRFSPDETSQPIKQTITGKTRKVSIILFGEFRVEEITMPALVEDSAGIKLLADPVIPARPFRNFVTAAGSMIAKESVMSKDMYPPWMFDIANLLEILYTNCDLPNHHDGWPAPPPPLQFFTFILRKHFGLQFQTKAFEVYANQPYKEFVESAAIFHSRQSSARGYGLTILNNYRKPVLSFRRMS